MPPVPPRRDGAASVASGALARRLSRDADPVAASWLEGGAALRVFACFAVIYALSYGLRTINTVIAPELVAEFGLDNTTLGSLTAAYLIAFAAMQLPLGWCLDRFGPRLTQSALLLVALAGCAVYALADGVAMLWLGRALIGAGVSGCLISAFKGFRQWYPPHLQGRFAAWMLVAGTSGVMLSTSPVQWLVPLVGWRGVFWVCAALLAAGAAAYFAMLPREPRRTPGAAIGVTDAADGADRADAVDAADAADTADTAGGYRQVLASPFFWRTSLYGVFHQGGFIALQTLWIGPWFTRVAGATAQQAADWLLLLNAALLAAYVACGWIAPRLEDGHGWTAPRLGTAANALGAAMLGLVALRGADAGVWPWLVLAAASAPNMLVQTHFNLSWPAERSGRASTIYNLAVFAGAFALQSALGAAIDAFRAAGWGDADAFRAAFGLLWVAQAASLAGYAWMRAGPPDDQSGRVDGR